MSPASSFFLGKAIGIFLLIWLVVQAIDWVNDQVVWFIEAYAPYLIAAAIAVLLYLAFLTVRWFLAD